MLHVGPLNLHKPWMSEWTVSIPFWLYVSQTTCMWTWKPTVCGRLSAAPFTSNLIGRLASREFREQFKMPSILCPRRRSSSSSETVGLSRARGPAPPTSTPPALDFTTLKTLPAPSIAASSPASLPFPAEVVDSRKFSHSYSTPLLIHTVW